MKTLQVFISSPGDVYEERAIANRVIDRLQSEYIGRLVLEPVLWEHEPLVATSTFQKQIAKPSDTDVVIAILWSRLGTKLPKDFTRPDGTHYKSGTEYEFEEAIEGYRKNGKPDLLVYRKMAPPSVRLDDEKELMERLEQKKSLDEFVDKWFHNKAEGTLKAAFHAFDSPSDFETLLENHLHKLVERQLPKTASATSEARAVWRKGSPFRGLAAFEFEHAPVFFGRTKAVSDILQALRDQAADDRSFVLILGMSGGGKSSVARAGILPMLTRPGVIEGVGLWRRSVFRPTDVPGDLFTGLATALLREHALPSLDTEGKGPGELAQVLEQSPQAAVALIKGALNHEATANKTTGDARLALVVDQMEELYTQDDVLPKHRKAFVDVLDALARCGRVWIIGTLRSDFYPRLANLPKLGMLKDGAGQYDLVRPTANEIGQMIRLPTRAAGLSFEEDPTSSERLDDMLRDAAAEHPEVLPLLQFTLEELYQRRTEDGMLTLQAYRDLGGVEGSLAQRAETVFKDLPDDVEEELPKVLNALVSIEQDGHETIGRKRALMSDVTTEKSRELVETFIENRLFVTELADDDSAVVTVAHEALLWHWPRVKEWVAQNRENLRIRGRIAQAAERWEAENRPADLLLPSGKPLVEAETLLEQDIELHDDEAGFIAASMSKAKNLQRLKAGVVATVAILGMVAAWSAFVANQQRDFANQARARAEIEAETAKQTTEFMVGLFEVSDPSEALGNTITAREIMDQGADRIEQELTTQPAIQATLMETIGKVYTSLGLYDQAIPLLKSALETRREVFGENSVEAASSLDRLGEVLKIKADYGTAQDFFESALSIRQNFYGDDHVDTARTVYELADLLSRTGDFENADLFYRRALELQRKFHSESSPEVARSLEGLAMNLYDLGNYEEPEEMMREVVAMRRKMHTAAHPDLADSLNNLALVLWGAGTYDEVEALYREALEMNRELYEGSHPTVAVTLNNLAAVLHEKGDYQKAERQYWEVIEIRQTSLGKVHPEVAHAMNNLAFVLYDKGDHEAALAMSRDSLGMYRQLFPDGHPDLARGLTNMARWLVDLGEYEEAEPMLVESLGLQRELLGADHPLFAVSETELGRVYLHTGRFAEASEAAQDAHRTLAETLSEEHWRTAWAGVIQGASLARLGDFPAAETLLLTCLDVIKADPSAGELRTDSTLRLVAGMYEEWGKPVQAARYLAMVGSNGNN